MWLLEDERNQRFVCYVCVPTSHFLFFQLPNLLTDHHCLTSFTGSSSSLSSVCPHHASSSSEGPSARETLPTPSHSSFTPLSGAEELGMGLAELLAFSPSHPIRRAHPFWYPLYAGKHLPWWEAWGCLAVLVTRWVNLSQERLISPFHFRSNVPSNQPKDFALHLSMSPVLLLKKKEHYYWFPRTPKIRLVTPTFMCKMIHREKG